MPTSLCQLAAWYGLDRTPLRGHDYTPTYYELFDTRQRMLVRKVMEIGIAHGWGLLLWREWFPNAEIYGIDANHEFMKNMERIRSYVANQGSEGDMRNAAAWAGDGFDLIMDDASHEPAHQISSAHIMFPLLRPGGWYVIEDVINADAVAPHLPAPCEIRTLNIARDPWDRLLIMRKEGG